MSDEKKKRIRNSTAEFLTFTAQSGGGIEARYEDETIWLTQKLISVELFDVSVPTVNEHLKNVFSSNELEEGATIRKFRIVRIEGTREVARDDRAAYNLDADHLRRLSRQFRPRHPVPPVGHRRPQRAYYDKTRASSPNFLPPPSRTSVSRRH